MVNLDHPADVLVPGFILLWLAAGDIPMADNATVFALGVCSWTIFFGVLRTSTPLASGAAITADTSASLLLRILESRFVDLLLALDGGVVSASALFGRAHLDDLF